ncbi:leukotriene A4 hydrolase C-terminal domain-containing protein [uncultured Hymenobacter sp.]|uniref:leukotriene A4 hydrolase C-terminal domain-containing protein n=1 Tax=uncultured Hymenobacter sp. TaxID=170016 RepID=UPI0035C97EB7
MPPRCGRASQADAALKQFLLHVGQRKFLVPLRRALLAAPGGEPARARKIYARARPNYHSVATGMLDALLAQA